MTKTWNKMVSVFLFGSALCMPAFGQWMEESFQLRTGWNSIFVTVDPQPSRADDLFAGLPIVSVWSRDDVPRITSGRSCDNDTDPDCASPVDTQWRLWVPSDSLHEAATNLRVIRGGRVYFVEASAPTPLSIVGRPYGDLKRWREGFNTAGFNVVNNPAGAPTFDAYLGPMPGFDPVKSLIYTMQSDGDLTRIPTTNQIIAGQGYFFAAFTDVVYDGPLSFNSESLRGINFFRRLLRESVELRNLNSNADSNVTVTYMPSAPVPSGPGVDNLPTNPTTPLPLYWLDYGEVVNDGGDPSGDGTDMWNWNVLTTHAFSLPAAALPSESPVPPSVLTLGVKRLGLPPAVLDNNLQGSQYQGLLEVKDDGGYRRVLPLAAQVLPGLVSNTASVAAGPIANPGLYVGSVSLTKVAWLTAGAKLVKDLNPTNIESESVFRCNGVHDPVIQCTPDRKLCRGTPSVDASNITCDGNADCPLGTACTIIPRKRCEGTPELELIGIVCADNTDCPGGTCEEVQNCPFGEACMGYCTAGQVNSPCQTSAGCDTSPQAGNGFCSADASDAALRPAPFPIDFSVIIHVDSAGVIHKLLTEVTLLSDDDDQLVLATPDIDPIFRDTLQGALVVNRERFARRVSTAAFAFDDDLNLVPTSDALTGSTLLPADHPLNPFFHKYHPDHDCRDQRGDPAPDCNQFGESTDIGRNFEFRFDPDPPPGEDILDWGDVVLGGTYTEIVSGLHKRAVKTQGEFRIHRVSEVGVLNAVAPSNRRAGR